VNVEADGNGFGDYKDARAPHKGIMGSKGGLDVGREVKPEWPHDWRALS
jgi:hypothetical protein